MWALQSGAPETESETKISQVGVRLRDMKMCRTDRQTAKERRGKDCKGACRGGWEEESQLRLYTEAKRRQGWKIQNVTSVSTRINSKFPSSCVPRLLNVVIYYAKPLLWFLRKLRSHKQPPSTKHMF